MSPHHPRKGIELYSEADAYLVIVDLPGRSPGDVTCRWRDGRLAIDAPPAGGDTDGDPFQHTLGVPRRVRVGGIDATMEEGVLQVRLPVDDRDGYPVDRDADGGDGGGDADVGDDCDRDDIDGNVGDDGDRDGIDGDVGENERTVVVTPSGE